MIDVRVISCNGRTLPQKLARTFDERGGTMGRADTNELVLPDPDRLVSRMQARVVWSDDHFVLVNVGANALDVDGHAVASGAVTRIAPGNRIAIGGYVLEVAVVDDGARTSAVSEATVSPDRPKDAPTTKRNAASAARQTDITFFGSGWSGEIAEPVREGADQAATGQDSTGASDSSRPRETDPLLNALVEGLGVRDLPLPQGMTPEFMKLIGRLLRQSTQGTLDLLFARAATKREIHADITMIVSRENNPLKSSPNVEVALAHLLSAPRKGFLMPVEAVEEAYDDLEAHESGLVDGVQAALAAVMKHFDPVALERRIAEKPLVDALLPHIRRARLWNLFADSYRDVVREAEDDFHALMRREFLRAYEERARRRGEAEGDSSTSSG